MNNLLLSLMLAVGETGEAAQGAAQPDVWHTVIEYIVYGVIIIVSIFLLVLLRKRTRLPRHGELKKKLAALLADVKAIAPGEKRMEFLKAVSRAMYKADNLSYTAAMLAEKERYADLGRISSLVGEARAELSEYKFGKKEPEEAEGIGAAVHKLEDALSVLDGVIERDSEMKRKG